MRLFRVAGSQKPERRSNERRQVEQADGDDNTATSQIDRPPAIERRPTPTVNGNISRARR
ncbi:hypothetical protein UCMB321_4714 [Pseudomonas batumici]|uniref:Uncharacterized protein n=1 Tax=Pseudomonas batumici TaxID=226910 RepID=A0A0C2I8Q5_9PSED|nr:hypothetical protein UCMB321_4714 [Pseudomonas batumici]